MTDRQVEHGSFTLERTYPTPPAGVYAAWATLEAKQQWFNGPDGLDPREHTLDFRPGGAEHLVIEIPDGPTFRFDSTYYDLVPEQRIVYAYDMHMNDARISVSVCTVTFAAAAGGTHLVVTEQGVYLDGLDTSAQREAGTHDLLDALGTALAS